MPSILQQPPMAPPRNTMVIRADTMPGSDAGVKIAAAIAALPAGVGGFVDATAFLNSQNCTGFTIPPGVTVQMSPVLYTLTVAGGPIIVNNGARLLGGGNGNPGCTRLRPSTNFNAPLIRCVSTAGTGGFWHSGYVGNFRLDGNKTNQSTSGHGMEVYKMGELSRIEYMNIHDCKQAGIYVQGSQSGTNSIENCTVNGCTTYGMQFDAFTSGLLVKSCGGDANPYTFGVTAPASGGGQLTFVDPKSEGATLAPLIISGAISACNIAIVGGNFTTGVGLETAAIRIAADTGSGADPHITIIGLGAGNMPMLIDDLENAVTVMGVSATITRFTVFVYKDGVIHLDASAVAVPL